nr:NADH dehydrogenase subunit 5 [Lardoglyphus konoi]
MFYLFAFLFFFSSLVLMVFGIFFMDFNSLTIELFIPYGVLNEMPLSFCVDFISLFFFSVVSLISSVVFIYSKYYMGSYLSDQSKDNFRFFYLLFLFVISMFFLVFSSSWLTVMLGWDGLGLVSFLLVIYYNNPSSLDSGLITVFTNRVGDCLFILSFIFMFYCGWTSSLSFLTYVYCFLFIVILGVGCITKSAQIPFSSWLPAAMAAPTPVSSLVHSSTLVTAGVYLLVRFNFLLMEFYNILMVVSLLTVFVAGLCALYEMDFKKVVAMSTLSQLGFMIFSISMGYWILAYLHMMFHAFFKSVLFLSTGNLMHFFLGDQDSRYFGTLGNSFFSKLFFSMSCLSLMGFPFSLGFYSKDLILGGYLFEFSGMCGVVFFISCCFTVSYSLRLISMGFLNFPSFNPSLSFLEDLYFFSPVIIIYFFTVFSGNFFFYYFAPLSFMGFFDYFIGLLVILGGVLFFYYQPNFYFNVNIFMSLVFLSFLSSSYLSGKIDRFSFKNESSWGEILGGKGVMNLLSSFLYMGFSLYKLNFLMVPIFLVIVFALVK